MSIPEFEYLLPLLDDNDEEVYLAIKEKILEAGEANLPLLENALNSATSLLQYERIESLIFQLKSARIKEQFIRWARSDNKSLLEGWMIISSIQGKEISIEKIRKLLRQIFQEIWVELNDNQTSFEKIAKINRIIFSYYNFKINTTDISACDSSFIDKILISRKGNPYSLNILYLIIARELSLPLLPIHLNGKLFLGWNDPALSREAFGEIIHPFLFFIDVDHGGKIIGIKEFELLMKEYKLFWSRELYLSKIDLIRDLLLNIGNSLSIAGEKDKASVAEEFLHILDNL